MLREAHEELLCRHTVCSGLSASRRIHFGDRHLGTPLIAVLPPRLYGLSTPIRDSCRNAMAGFARPARRSLAAEVGRRA